MPIELEYEKMDAVPAEFRGLYEEKDGRAVLVGVNGMKTQADVDAVRTALTKERNDHKITKDKLKGWEGLNKDEVLGKLDILKGIEDKIGGDLTKLDESDLVKTKIAQATGPLTREIGELKKKVGEQDAEIGVFKAKDRSRQINDIVRSAATKSKVHATALPDIEMAAGFMMEFDDSGKLITKDGVAGVTPGLEAEAWLGEMQKIRSHWWPESVGGGAGGSGKFNVNGGNNPFSHEHWNLTAQGALLKEPGGRETADRLAKLAGTTVGGKRPPAKK